MPAKRDIPRRAQIKQHRPEKTASINRSKKTWVVMSKDLFIYCTVPKLQKNPTKVMVMFKIETIDSIIKYFQ